MQRVTSLWKQLSQGGADVKMIKQNQLSLYLVLITDFKYFGGHTKPHASKLKHF